MAQSAPVQYVECLELYRSDNALRGRAVQPLPGVTAGAATLSAAMMGMFNVADASVLITVGAFTGIPVGAEFEFLHRSDGTVLQFAPRAGTELVSIEGRRRVFPGGGCAVLKYIDADRFALIGALIHG
jgi:hypothetical protein